MWVADWYVAFDGFNTDVLVNRLLEVLVGTLLTDVVKEQPHASPLDTGLRGTKVIIVVGTELEIYVARTRRQESSICVIRPIVPTGTILRR
jgi:hypothetical protein